MCYIFTHDTCCTNIHDIAIQAAIDTLVSPSCEEIFYDLIQYYCFGCYNIQSTYINTTTQTIYICKDFAARIWTNGDPDGAKLEEI